MIIGREKEIEKLNELYDSGNAELLALYGRRRVGKTFLIDEVFKDRITFRHSGLSPVDGRYKTTSGRRSKMKEQLKHFYRSLLMQGMKKSKQPESWLDAFYMLEDFLQEQDDGECRQLVFIDEIQWLDTARSGFMTGFEAFWNGWACHRNNIMVVVCGSSTSWIMDNMINNHVGLYNRITYQIKLEPFSLYECEKYFKEKGFEISRYDITFAYMAMGGVPYYLNYFDRKLSLAQNIDEVLFDSNAPLKDEYDRLFSSLFINPDTMKSIVEAIGSKNRGLTRQEILAKTGIANSGEFSNYLKALISGTFIIEYCSFGGSKREKYYKLVDPFCVFYLKFVKNTMSGGNLSWINIADSGMVNTWKGYAFENVCFNHIRQIKKALGISGVSTTESLWSKRRDEDSAGAQIDLIIERKDNVINMCEAKFYNSEFSVDRNYHFTLAERKNMMLDLVSPRIAVHNTLITTYGLKRNEYSGDFINTVTLSDLFEK